MEIGVMSMDAVCGYATRTCLVFEVTTAIMV
jgi:hypothetical protein